MRPGMNIGQLQFTNSRVKGGFERYMFKTMQEWKPIGNPVYTLDADGNVTFCDGNPGNFLQRVIEVDNDVPLMLNAGDVVTIAVGGRPFSTPTINQDGETTTVIDPGQGTITIRLENHAGPDPLLVQLVQAPIDSLSYKCPIVRYMEALNVNQGGLKTGSNNASRWDTLPHDQVVRHALEMGIKELWINLPSECDIPTATAIAKIYEPVIASGCTLVVELANEFWNSQFPHQAYLKAQGGTWPAAYQLQGSLTQSLVQVIKDMYPGKVRSALSGNRADQWPTVKALEGASGDIDIIAIPAYFGGGITENTEDPWKEMLNTISDIYDNVVSYKDAFPLQTFMVYEAGQSLIPGQNNGPTFDAHLALIDSPRMTAMYKTLWSILEIAGVDTCIYFKDTYVSPGNQYGFWGAEDHPMIKSAIADIIGEFNA